MRTFPKPPFSRDTLWETFLLRLRFTLLLLFFGLVGSFLAAFAIQAPIVLFGTIGLLGLLFMAFFFYTFYINAEPLIALGKWGAKISLEQLKTKAKELEQLDHELAILVAEVIEKEGLSDTDPIPEAYHSTIMELLTKREKVQTAFEELAKSLSESIGNLVGLRVLEDMRQKKKLANNHPSTIGELKALGV